MTKALGVREKKSANYKLDHKKLSGEIISPISIDLVKSKLILFYIVYTCTVIKIQILIHIVFCFIVNKRKGLDVLINMAL